MWSCCWIPPECSTVMIGFSTSNSCRFTFRDPGPRSCRSISVLPLSVLGRNPYRRQASNSAPAISRTRSVVLDGQSIRTPMARSSAQTTSMVLGTASGSTGLYQSSVRGWGSSWTVSSHSPCSVSWAFSCLRSLLKMYPNNKSARPSPGLDPPWVCVIVDVPLTVNHAPVDNSRSSDLWSGSAPTWSMALGPSSKDSNCCMVSGGSWKCLKMWAICESVPSKPVANSLQTL